ncbi:hypothetical protein RND71_002070 [Anisodus tanguticus]|uniref:Uncharacterized protein n=1 Tax=Anisodus tanguticus TaxID=243964 RepID=A0AAE1T2E4_9SOLA|nr:hypothetical protein RND71_002070 [Anisodus tanguticus]
MASQQVLKPGDITSIQSLTTVPSTSHASPEQIIMKKNYVDLVNPNGGDNMQTEINDIEPIPIKEVKMVDGEPSTINENVDEQIVQTRNTFATLTEDNEIPEKNDKTEVTNETD